MRNKGLSARYFVVFAVIATGNVFSYAVELLAADLPTMLTIVRIEYIFLLSMPVSYLLFILAYFRKHNWLQPANIILLSIIPMVQLILAWTNDRHKLNWAYTGVIEVNGLKYFDRIPGIAGDIGAYYLYVLMALILLTLFREGIWAGSQYREQLVPLAIGSVLPWTGSMLHMFHISPFPHLDLIPFGIILAVPLIGVSIFRYGLFDMRPAAYDRVVKCLADAVIILDNQNRVVDLNPVALEMLKVPENQARGHTAVRLLPRHLFDIWKDVWETHTEIFLDIDGQDRYLDMRITPVTTNSGQVSGRVVVLRDITEAKIAQKQLEKLVTLDPLTGILNRRHFFEMADAVFGQSQRYNRPLCAAMIDLDFFKNVNDTYGHLVGDQVLISVARFLQLNLRDVDILARYGGEEFILFMPETTLEAAHTVAERLRKKLEAQAFPVNGGSIQLTISIGLAAITKDVRSAYMLIDMADQALYRCKYTGRNQTVFYTPELNQTE